MNNRDIKQNLELRPLAQRDGLVVKKLENEMLVYETERQKAHCLNHNAALIWEHCDGSRSVGELSGLLDLTDNTSNNISKAQKEQIVDCLESVGEVRSAC